MRVIGKRKFRRISAIPSGELLKEGALFNDELHKLPTGKTSYIPKGVYRYKTHEDAEKHQNDCLAQGMANNV